MRSKKRAMQNQGITLIRECMGSSFHPPPPPTGMNEQLLKTSGADVLSSRKKHRKTLGAWHPL